MRKEFKDIKFKNEKYGNNLPYGIGNFTYIEFNYGGIILTSNKNFDYLKTAKLFIPYEKIEYIVW